MKPFPGAQIKDSKQRRVSENAFGIISNVYRVLRKPLLLEPEWATKVVLAVVLYLHNFLRKSSSRTV